MSHHVSFQYLHSIPAPWNLVLLVSPSWFFVPSAYPNATLLKTPLLPSHLSPRLASLVLVFTPAQPCGRSALTCWNVNSTSTETLAFSFAVPPVGFGMRNVLHRLRNFNAWSLARGVVWEVREVYPLLAGGCVSLGAGSERLQLCPLQFDLPALVSG